MRPIDADALKQDLLNRSFFPAIVATALKNAPTVNPYEWISVEDRLPDELFTAVLIYCPKNQNIYCAYLNARNEWHIFDYGAGQQVVESVTHWMPLPTPPTTKHCEKNLPKTITVTEWMEVSNEVH